MRKYRCSIQGDGAQHTLPDNVGAEREPGALRRAPRPAADGERPDRPSRPHRRPRLRALHREVPPCDGPQVL